MTESKASGHQAVYDVRAGLGRRHEAKLRSVSVGICGCIRDPEHDRNRCSDEITDVMVEAAVAAIEHLGLHGTPGLLDVDMCKAMWRRGYPRLAVDCATRAGWAA
jgi:hypothetical protein